MSLLEEIEAEQKVKTAQYKTMMESEGFEHMLEIAILNDECLLCGDGDVLKHGLCLACCCSLESPMHLDVLKNYEVQIVVRRKYKIG